MIYYFTPYSTEKNLGKAYNQYMRLLPSLDDWGCLMDADTMFLCSDFGTQINEIVNNNPDAGLITCVTNRAGYHNQRYNDEFSHESDIKKHRLIAIECREKYYSEVNELKSNINGHLLLIKKSTWLKVGGFSENTIRDEQADSNLLGLDDNISKKILNNGMKILLMKGVYLFHYYRLNEGEHFRDHLIKNFIKPETKLKFGAAYNLCTGSELIMDSILSIRKNVDYITVIYNEISVNNIPVKNNLKELLQKLKDEKLIDDFKLFVHKKEIEEKEIHNKHKEIEQRNEGLQMCKDNGCTHFMTMDCDEFYTDSEFKKAKEEIIKNDFNSTYCKMISYYKDESHVIDPPEEYFVPFIYKIINNCEFHIQEFPVLCDPSREYFVGKYKIFDRSELQMHHFTYVRNDLADKLFNAPTKEKYEGHFKVLIKYFNQWKEGDQGLTYNGYCDLKKIKPYFKLNINNKIYVGVASIYERIELLKDTIDSVISQCDEIHVYLNDYEFIPDFLKDNPKVFYYNKPAGDIGDVGKFYGLQNKEGYLFTMDDDLIYSKDYVQKMISGIKQYDCPVTIHGRIMNAPPIESYYSGSVKENFNCFIESKIECPVHIAGTGCMAWNSKHIKFDIKDFEHKNMSDIYASILIHKNGLLIYCLFHSNCCVVQNPKSDESKSIWSINNVNDKIQTKLINENYRYFNLFVEHIEENTNFVETITEEKDEQIYMNITIGDNKMTLVKTIVIKERDGSEKFGTLGTIMPLEQSTANVLIEKGLVAIYNKELEAELMKSVSNIILKDAMGEKVDSEVKEDKELTETNEDKTDTETNEDKQDSETKEDKEDSENKMEKENENDGTKSIKRRGRPSGERIRSLSGKKK